jgi:hypothetical protein
MAASQIRISKNPSNGAINLYPRDTKISLNVPIDTSMILAKKINKGIIIHVKYHPFIIASMMISV